MVKHKGGRVKPTKPWPDPPKPSARVHVKNPEEKVDHPDHYNETALEVIDALEELGLCNDFHLATAVKYICRCHHKGSFVQDLEKAVWYLKRRIELGRG